MNSDNFTDKLLEEILVDAYGEDELSSEKYCPPCAARTYGLLE
jgi:hypothetical protein